ncbi:hypothetical protein EFL81_10245 [Weissella confusa]|uniref:hypothetical protein n=1 Tax=Weissella confusa TaxID=1583 RepID=UPI00223BEE4D|nr:hypothetical protein [Weissella confusa]MCS9991184.1 hypothetical protein [Weissella confusa]MCS9997185.1 hypothetical protein [Weissella confusa]
MVIVKASQMFEILDEKVEYFSFELTTTDLLDRVEKAQFLNGLLALSHAVESLRDDWDNGLLDIDEVGERYNGILHGEVESMYHFYMVLLTK